jgi:hypothetical protein
MYLGSYLYNKLNKMHYFSLYFVTTPLHISGPFVAHHQEAECIMWRMVLVLLLKRLSGGTIATLYTWPPDDGLQMGPKHVEAW